MGTAPLCVCVCVCIFKTTGLVFLGFFCCLFLHPPLCFPVEMRKLWEWFVILFLYITKVWHFTWGVRTFEIDCIFAFRVDVWNSPTYLWTGRMWQLGCVEKKTQVVLKTTHNKILFLMEPCVLWSITARYVCSQLWSQSVAVLQLKI